MAGVQRSRPGGGARRVQVELPGPIVRALEEHVKHGTFPSVEEAVLAGARLVAGLGPRALDMLKEGADADALVQPAREEREGRWLE